MAELPRVIREKRIEIVILATDPDGAQAVAERAVAAGVRAILNFAPVKLDLGPEVVVNSVNMVPELESLSFALTHMGAAGS